MFSHIHSATVVVADQQAARDFYVNTLGWDKGLDVPMGEHGSFITVVPHGAQTHLALVPSAWFPGHLPNKSTGVSLITPDIDNLYTTLTERGVKFKEPPTMMPWGARAVFLYDLDGNELFVVEQAA